MTAQSTLSPSEDPMVSAPQLPPIKQDEIAEEVFAVRQYDKKLTRTVIVTQVLLLSLCVCVIYGLATRPARRIYIKVDQVGRAIPVRYQDLEHYTPDAAVAKNYLTDWATYRFSRLRANVLETFPKNYLFLESKYGKQLKERDMHENVAANVAAGHEPENDLLVLSTNLTSFGKQSHGDQVVAVGTAEIAIQKIFRNDDRMHVQTWIIAVRFFINPDQVEAQSADHPEYQVINPLGLTIVEFIMNRTNVEASPKQ